jgi:ribonucleoside-diphosphate reductase alpha chain
LAPRAEALTGSTYKLRWPNSAHAVYITINDLVEDGRKRPFEIFINSKNLEHYAWTLGLTRMISAVFRRGGNVGVVEKHLATIKLDEKGQKGEDGAPLPSHDPCPPSPAQTQEARSQITACPQCGAMPLVRREGCNICLDCGYSKCD